MQKAMWAATTVERPSRHEITPKKVAMAKPMTISGITIGR
jgi:hypothetical protein